MTGIYSASNEERSRAILRTILELVLEEIEDAVNFSDQSHFKKLFGVLEDTCRKLNHEKDLPLDSDSAFLNTGSVSSMMDKIVAFREALKQTWKIRE